MTVERYEGLEATVANLKLLLGDEGARLLFEAFGGRRIYVPRSPGSNHPITAVLGQPRAAQLAGAFHGVEIDVPMSPQTQVEIRRLNELGWTRARIARELKVTERWVYKTLEASQDRPTTQGRLFG